MISVIAWIIAIGAWLVILLGPVALVDLAVVPSWRRWWLRPLLRRVTGRTGFHRAFAESLKGNDHAAD